LLFGEKVTHIQWLTYYGGTRVFYENEPDFTQSHISKKWAAISGAGFIATTIPGYLFTILYFVVANAWVKTGLCFFSIIFLVADSGYFLIGSIFNFGDVVGIRETLKLSKWISVAICAGVFLLHCAVIYGCFYRIT
jgi:hypothetical protein